jgi:rhodanese-related sulfurtransferase
MKSLSTEDLRLMIANNQDFVLINVLPEETFRDQHIPDSINIPQDQDNFADQVETAAGGKGAKIVVYCGSFDCDASTKAARKLDEAGFTDVYDYEGGVKAWRESGLMIEAGV